MWDKELTGNDKEVMKGNEEMIYGRPQMDESIYKPLYHVFDYLKNKNGDSQTKHNYVLTSIEKKSWRQFTLRGLGDTQGKRKSVSHTPPWDCVVYIYPLLRMQ